MEAARLGAVDGLAARVKTGRFRRPRTCAAADESDHAFGAVGGGEVRIHASEAQPGAAAGLRIGPRYHPL